MGILDRQARRGLPGQQFLTNPSPEMQRLQKAEPGVKPFDGEMRPSIEEMRAPDDQIDPEAKAGLEEREQFIPELTSPEQAYQLAMVLQKNRGAYAQDEDSPEFTKGMSPTRFELGLEALNRYEAAHPGAITAVQEEATLNAWRTENIDTSPRKSAEEEKAERQFLVKGGFSGQFAPRKVAKPAEGTRADVLRRKEQEGLDTLTGFGGLGKVVGAATEFNSPRARVAYIDASIRQDIQNAGLTVPEGQPVAKFDEDLQEVKYLRPEDGKLVWTLADGEIFRPQDVGALADLPSLFSMAGAAVANIAPQGRFTKNFFARHPLLGEYMGDLGGRQLGTMFEYLINIGDVTPEEFTDAMNSNYMASAVETGVSRAAGRVIQGIQNRGKVHVGKNQTVEEVEANIQEAADAMERVQELSGKEFQLSSAEASNATRALQEQAGREKTLSRKAADSVEEARIDNVNALAAANQRIADDALGTTNASRPDYNPGPTVKNANEAVKTFRAEAGTIDGPYIAKDAEDGTITYNYLIHKADAITKSKPVRKDGDDVVSLETDNIWSMTVDPTRNVATLDAAFEPTAFRGSTPAVFEDMLKRLEKYGDIQIYSDGSVSPQAQAMIGKLNKEGWDIKLVSPENTRTLESGTQVNLTDDGVYRIDGYPGKKIQDPLDGFQWNETAAKMDVEDAADILRVTEAQAAEANSVINRQIGWSQQTATSNIAVANPRTTPLRTTVRRLQNRSEQALTQAGARDVDKVLNDSIRKTMDEDGNDILSGLASEELDIGQVLIARTKLDELIASSKNPDPDLIKLRENVDTVLNNRQWTNKKTAEKVGDAHKANVMAAVAKADDATRFMNEANALVNGSVLFKRNQAGDLINVNLTGLRRIMGNHSQFIKQMEPVLNANPELRSSAGDALGELYRQDVLNTGSGWTRSKHNTFIKRFGPSMDAILDEGQNQAIREYRLTDNGSVDLWTQRKQRSDAILQRQRQRLGLEDGTQLNANTIIETLSDPQRMGGVRATNFLWHLKAESPRLYEEVREQSILQVQQKLHRRFFDVENTGVNQLATAKELNEWLTDNTASLKALHGDQYVTDLRSVVQAHSMDARRTRVRGKAPETQGDVIRVLRSLLGPLSRPQRQITAGNYVMQRRLARKVLEVYSDPAALRQLKAARGLTPNSRAGIAALSRLGIFDAAGLSEDDPQFIPKARELLEWAFNQDNLSIEENANAEVEQ